MPKIHGAYMDLPDTIAELYYRLKIRHLSSHIDMHTHAGAGSTFHLDL